MAQTKQTPRRSEGKSEPRTSHVPYDTRQQARREPEERDENDSRAKRARYDTEVDLEAKVNNLIARNVSAQAKIEELKAWKTTATSTITREINLRTKVNEELQALREADSQLTEELQVLRKVKNQVTTAASERQSLYVIIEQKCKEIHDLRHKVEEKGQELDKANEEYKDLLDKTCEHTNTIANLTAENQELRNELQKANERARERTECSIAQAKNLLGANCNLLKATQKASKLTGMESESELAAFQDEIFNLAFAY